MKKREASLLLKTSVIGVILLGLSLRLTGVNWDQNQHLHPDERFLTMVQLELELSRSWGEYWDAARSSLNPYNKGYDFFVYGTLPLTWNKTVATLLDNDDYNRTTLQGRVLAAMADVTTLIIVMGLMSLLVKKYKLSEWLVPLSGLFYAIAVLPIQLSHFFAVDPWLSLFSLTAVICAWSYRWEKKSWKWVAAGVSFGAAMACKVSAIYVAPLVWGLVILEPNLLKELGKGSKLKRSGRIGLGVLSVALVMGVVSFISYRILDPHAFEGSSLRISEQFWENLKSLKSFEGDEVWYPPAVQWINRPAIWYAVYNMAVFGVGVPYFILVLIGLAGIGMKLRDKKLADKTAVSWVVVWAIGFFVYQGSSFVKALRYFFILYPFLAIGAAIGLAVVCEKLKKTRWSGGVVGGIILSTLIWPLMFMAIYLKPHSRIVASEWIYENLPVSNKVLTEHWDDPLPLLLPTHPDIRFNGKQLPVFNPDTEAKWLEMEELLNEGELYILSSNRAWGSIMRVPDKYPRQSKFYEELMRNELDWEKIAEFTTYPSLEYLGIPITFSDDWADETFTVYDHPKVMIFRKQGWD